MTSVDYRDYRSFFYSTTNSQHCRYAIIITSKISFCFLYCLVQASIGHLRALVELDVKNNQLIYLPGELSSVHQSSTHTCIGYVYNIVHVLLTESLCKLKKLVVLNLTNNLLVKLPSRIGDMVNLQELSIQ